MTSRTGRIDSSAKARSGKACREAGADQPGIALPKWDVQRRKSQHEVPAGPRAPGFKERYVAGRRTCPGGQIELRDARAAAPLVQPLTERTNASRIASQCRGSGHRMRFASR